MDRRLALRFLRPVGPNLPALAGVCLLLAALAEGAARPPAAVLAQEPTPWPQVTLDLYGNGIQLAEPRPGLSAVLYRSGHVQAYAASLPMSADQSRLTLRPESGQEDAVLRPGDRLDLRLAGERRSLMIPVLAGIIDREAGSISGRAPVTGTLELRDAAGAEQAIPFMIDHSGRWLALQEDVQPLPRRASLRWQAPGGEVSLRLWLQAPSLMIGVGTRDLRLQTSMGDRLTLTLSDTDGRLLTQATGEVLGLNGPWIQAIQWKQGQDPDSWPPIAAGTQVSILAEAAQLGKSQSLRAAVPQLLVRIDPDEAQVHGVLGPHARQVAFLRPADEGKTCLLDLQLEEPDPSDGSRAFTAPLPNGCEPVPGLRAEVYLYDAAGTTYSATAAIPKATLLPAIANVEVVADSGRPITVTWSSSDGRLLGKRSGRPDASGNLRLNLRDKPDNRVPFDEGDHFELDLGDADPLSLRLPPLTAKTDGETMVLSGRAPAGGRVVVGLGPLDQWTAFDDWPKTLAADDEGRYELDLREALDEPDLEPGDAAGEVVIAIDDWAEVVKAWGAPLVQLDLQGGAIWSIVPTPCAYDGELRAAGANQPVGRLPQPPWLEAYDPGQVVWSSSARDAWGQTVVPRAGDVLSLKACDEAVDLTVPRLEVAVDLAASQVRLQTDPRQALGLEVRRLDGAGDQRKVRTDATGLATVDLEDIPLKANDRILVTVDQAAGLEAFREVVAHGLRVDLDSGAIRGQWLPGRSLTFRWQRGAERLATWDVPTGIDGRLETLVPQLATLGGLRAGDRLSLAEGAEAPLLLDIPEFTLRLDPADRRQVDGRAPAGAQVQLLAGDWLETPDSSGVPLRPSWKSGVADGQGRWSLALDRHDTDRVTALLSLPEGHVVTRSASRSVGLFQLGATAFCGLAGQGGGAVAAELRAADGRALGSTAGKAGPDGAFWLPLRGEGGGPLVSAEGMAARLQWGGAETTVSLPRWQAQLDWKTGLVQGYGPPDQLLTFRRRDDVCPAPAPDAWSLAFQGEPAPEAQPRLVQAATSPSGWFQADLTPLLPPGATSAKALEATWNAAPGLNLGALLPREQLRILSRGERLTVFSAPGFPQNLVLLGPDGQVRATAAGIPDAAGWLGLGWRAPGGETVSAAPGDRVLSSSLGGNQSGEGVVLPELSLDWSPGDALVVQTALNQTVQLRLVLADGREIMLSRDAEADGRIRLDDSTLPARSNWSMAAVRGVLAELRLDDRHSLIARAGRAPRDLPPPERPEPEGPAVTGHRIHLPRLENPTHP